MLIPGLLSLGLSPSAFGQTLALLITFLGIGVLVNLLVVYIVAQVMAEHKQNQERQSSLEG
jgi:phage shock protein PspC (stress-responsive transcriptional regulator)